jgi:hypothetical protein
MTRQFLLLAEPVVSRAPNRWGPHLLFTALVLAVVVLGYLGMRRSWKRRLARQADIPALPAPPTNQEYRFMAEGLFLGATFEGNWLDRVAAHGLAARTRGDLRIGTEGIRMNRALGKLPQDVQDSQEWIPREALTAVRLDTAHAGKVLGEGGVLVFSWHLGPKVVEMGFRSDDARQHEQFRRAIEGLLPTPAVGAAR